MIRHRPLVSRWITTSLTLGAILLLVAKQAAPQNNPQAKLQLGQTQLLVTDPCLQGTDSCLQPATAGTV